MDRVASRSAVRRRSEHESEPKELWLITLTDLLNVLLCLFVFRMAMTPPTPPQPDIPVVPPPVSVETGPLPRILRLRSGSFATGTEELTLTGAEQLQSFAAMAIDESSTIRVLIHSRETETPTAWDSSPMKPTWALARDRTLAIVRQLIDAGVEPSAISTETYATSERHPNQGTLENSGEFSDAELFAQRNALPQKSALIVQEGMQARSGESG